MNEAAPSPALIWCPFPDRASAEAAADALLDARLVACANIVGGITSLFRWRGERDRAEEAGLLLKTNTGALDAAIARLGELNPYDEPTIVGWRCDAAAPGTAAWLAALGG